MLLDHDTQRLVFSSSLQNISLIEHLINSIVTEYHISEDMYGNILISLTEAVTNAIVHGNHCEESKKVYVSYTLDADMLCFKVQDEGLGFNPDEVPDPTQPNCLEQLSGRGVYIIKALADKVEFANNGTCVALEFRLAAS